MPLAITLCFDQASAAPLEKMWRTLADQKIDFDRYELGYPPHITLAIYADETPVEQLTAALERIAPDWDALPVTLVGFGSFPGPTSVLWAVPVITPELLNRNMTVQAALPDFPVDPHYRAGSWMPHVTLSGALSDPGPALTALTVHWRPHDGLLSRLELVKFRPVEVLTSHHLKGRANRLPLRDAN